MARQVITQGEAYVLFFDTVMLLGPGLLPGYNIRRAEADERAAARIRLGETTDWAGIGGPDFSWNPVFGIDVSLTVRMDLRADGPDDLRLYPVVLVGVSSSSLGIAAAQLRASLLAAVTNMAAAAQAVLDRESIVPTLSKAQQAARAARRQEAKREADTEALFSRGLGAPEEPKSEKRKGRR